MTEDMPTVDGARAEAERRLRAAWARSETRGSEYADGFVAGAEWLAPTVAALEAEVARLRAEVDEVTERQMAELSDAAPQEIDPLPFVWPSGVRSMFTHGDGERLAFAPRPGFDQDPSHYPLRRSSAHPVECTAADLPAIDAAPQAVAAPEVVETAEGMDALPVGSVVRTSAGMVCERWQRRWHAVGTPNPWPIGASALPARVLYRPDATDGREEA